ncbi:hypothetical protein AAFC00_002987 [Neodothiora populina]|uniref:Peptidase S53 domain-containing protein n=1 Tax=Neodothiora populina TaxID=2781224 RepID=A0ABR3P968_9PEZI
MKIAQVVRNLVAASVVCEAASTYRGRASHVLHEKRSDGPSAWTRSVRVHRDAILPIRIGLVQTNLEHGYDHLMDVSHPSSPNFGKHWTAEQVHEAFAPEEESVQVVKDWLIASGIDENDIVQSDNKGWLAMDIPAKDAERLFQTEYHEHEHVRTGSTRIGCEHYYIPSDVKKHVDYVTPGVKLSAPVKKRTVKRSISPAWKHRPGPPHMIPPHSPHPWVMPGGAHQLPPQLQDCGRNITPACIKALYMIPDATLHDSVNSLGIFEDGDYYAQEDLDLFFAQYAPNVPQGTAPIPAFIDGAQAPVAQNSSLNTGESDIDLDMAYSLIYPQTVTLYQTDDFNYAEAELSGDYEGFLNTFLDALDGSYCNYTAYGITGDSPGIDPSYPDPAAGGYKGALQCGVYKPTRVITGSYGEAEYDLPPNYQKRQCNEFMKLALQGHTIMFSSSDYGVASYPGDVSPSGCLGADETIYNPDYPANCPYITAVGATRLYADQTVLDPESALQADLGGDASLFSSAGGFANYFKTPDYQKKAVGEYFARHDPLHPYYVYDGTNSSIGSHGGIYNRAGRGIPDVSANGALFRAYTDGIDYHYYGTSLASPLWASIITLINEERTAVGKGPVGFINPTLYANPNVLIDIKNGSNPGCGSSGFSAVEGWDPVTGLGSPHYPSLLRLFMSLP